jgi:hypothetical protein
MLLLAKLCTELKLGDYDHSSQFGNASFWLLLKYATLENEEIVASPDFLPKLTRIPAPM